MKPSVCFLVLLVHTISLAAQPKVLDYRIFQSPVRNQGDRNTCTGFAVAACLETFPGVPADISEQHIYAGLKMLSYGQKDPVEPGGRINLYAGTLGRFGFLHEGLMPYNPRQSDFDQKDANLVQVIRESQTGPVSMAINRSRIKAYVDSADCEVAEFDKGLSEANIKRLLQQGVKAIGIGYYVNAFWFDWEQKKNLLITPDSVGGFVDTSRQIRTFTQLQQQYGEAVFTQINDVFEPDGTKPWYYSSSKETQGHAVTIVGYNEQGFIIKNSWGSSWGDKGYATVSYAYHRLFAKRMIAIRRIRFVQPQNTKPVNALTDIRLKVIPQKGMDGVSLSLFGLDPQSDPDISSATYTIYSVVNGRKVQRDTRTILKAPGSTAHSCFEAILMKGILPPLEVVNGNATMQVELNIYTPSSNQPQQRIYRNIRWINSEHRGALL